MGKQFLDLLKDAPPIRYVYALYTFSIGFFFICVLTFDKHRTHDNVVQRISTGISTDISTGSRGYAPEVVNRTGTVGRQLVQELYSGDDPMGHKPSAPADFSYPHTNLNNPFFEEAVDHALALLVASYGAQQVNFVLEVGSFKGGSASLIVERLKSAGLVSCSVICVDPFSGDVNMWAWAKDKVLDYDFLSLSNGLPTIYETFRSNIIERGYQDFILPIPVPSIVGMRLLQRLLDEQRLSYRPNMIFLDSAHEKTETAFEIKLAWALLPEAGLIIGDDWAWEAVRSDVCEFAMNTSLMPLTQPESAEKVCGEVLLWQNIWLMRKPST